MPELARFQAAFGEALAGDFAALAPWSDAEARFAVYRNTTAKGLADALAAQFPTVVRVVGEAWIGEAARLFATAHPPAAPSLMAYGAAFPDWLESFPPAAELPYLANLARIDWAERQALFAVDAAPLGPEAFHGLSAEAYAARAAELHPAARALWFEDAAPSLWLALQGEAAPAAAELAAQPEGILILRPALATSARRIGRGAFAFLDACRAGLSLAAAGEAALAAEPDLPLAGLFAELIEAGAFVRLSTEGPRIC